MSGDDHPGCLSAQEIESIARDLPVAASSRAHVDGCERCGRAVEEARLNQRFLRELLEKTSPLDAETGPAAAPIDLAALLERGATTLLDDYTLLHEIHRGAQGVVYRALHVRSQRMAAVKVMHVGSTRRRMRMQREASLAAALAHPGIVTLHSCGELPDGRYAIAMELVNGETLDAWATRARSETRDPRAWCQRAARVVRRVCDAVQHAHTRGIIHRDLKPSNIIVDADDQPHVLDFGIARRAADDEGRAERVTMTGEIACTLAYAAPEQVRGDSTHVDTRSDVYSLGVVLYELVSGRSPYETDTSMAHAVTEILTAAPAPLRGACPGVDADLETVLLTALAKEPERRYQSAAALGDDLAAWLEGHAIDARRDSRLYVFRKTIARHRGPILVAATVALAIFGGTLAAVVASARGEAARQRARLEEQRASDEARRWGAIAEVVHELMPEVDPTFDAYAYGPMHRAVLGVSDRLYSGLFAEDPLTQASIHTALGDLCAGRGSLRLAEVQYREALRLLLMAPTTTPHLIAAARTNLAGLLVERNGLDEAERHLRQALDQLRPSGGAHGADLADALETMARIHMRRGQSTEAEALCVEALAALSDSAADEGRLARVRRTYCAVLMAGGRLDEAAREGRESLARMFDGTSDLHPELPATIASYGAVIRAADPTRAARLEALAAALRSRTTGDDDLRILIDLKTEVLGADHVDLLETMAARTNALAAKSYDDETRRSAEASLAFARRTVGGDAMVIADLLSVLGKCHLQAADRRPFEAAMRERLDILRRLLSGTDDVHLAVAVRECATFAGDLGLVDLADEWWTEAFDIARDRLGPTHREHAWMISRFADYVARVRRDPAEALRHCDRAIAMLEGIDPSPSFHLSNMLMQRTLFGLELGALDDASCSLDRLVQICRASPEARIYAPAYAAVVAEALPGTDQPELAALVERLGSLGLAPPRVSSSKE